VNGPPCAPRQREPNRRQDHRDEASGCRTDPDPDRQARKDCDHRRNDSGGEQRNQPQDVVPKEILWIGALSHPHITPWRVSLLLQA
jgi:hypothetical protein